MKHTARSPPAPRRGDTEQPEARGSETPTCTPSRTLGLSSPICMEKKATQECSRMLQKAPASRAAPGRLEQPPREKRREGGGCGHGDGLASSPACMLARVVAGEPLLQAPGPLRALGRRASALQVTAETWLTPACSPRRSFGLRSPWMLSPPGQAMSPTLSSCPTTCRCAFTCLPTQRATGVAGAQMHTLHKPSPPHADSLSLT